MTATPTQGGKPNSAMKHQKFSDLMQRYHGQMENALYAVEQLCEKATDEEHEICPFLTKQRSGSICYVDDIRARMGDHVPQHDIQIPEDDTQAQRKANR